MTCAMCGTRAQLQAVTFTQNVGMLVVRHTKTISGAFCGPCILSTYWSCTLTSALVGWFGMISLIINPFILLINVIQLLRSARVVGWGQALIGAFVILGIPIVAVAVLVLNSPPHGPPRH
jgi:hypothetical protein